MSGLTRVPPIEFVLKQVGERFDEARLADTMSITRVDRVSAMPDKRSWRRVRSISIRFQHHRKIAEGATVNPCVESPLHLSSLRRNPCPVWRGIRTRTLFASIPTLPFGYSPQLIGPYINANHANWIAGIGVKSDQYWCFSITSEDSAWILIAAVFNRSPVYEGQLK